MAARAVAHAGMQGVVAAVVRPETGVILVVVLVPEGVEPEAVAYADDPRSLFVVEYHIQVVVEVLLAFEAPIPEVSIAALIASSHPE